MEEVQDVKETSVARKHLDNVPEVQTPKDLITERTKGLDLSEHPTQTKQLSSKKDEGIERKN
ncbi:hypothetical protein OYT88_10435 [Sporolactobacillus sp. CQH2019]|uniref:hypothetical protein n=1 Tax=Sporolactobacillus sp. CQH2019 TaxID=3023512 RepID=UPI0023684325|nr:hypothetical protein [Sporolactobacillus sp. CQH2019]MDD9148966.1 hypothetical protein [Sporolactobacillus sp. CQH2019]